jgi:hypothetical protein
MVVSPADCAVSLTNWVNADCVARDMLPIPAQGLCKFFLSAWETAPDVLRVKNILLRHPVGLLPPLPKEQGTGHGSTCLFAGQASPLSCAYSLTSFRSGMILPRSPVTNASTFRPQASSAWRFSAS